VKKIIQTMTSQADLDAYYELIMQLVEEAGQVSFHEQV
jgi:hypothetical protein